MIDWSKSQVTEPPVLRDLSEEDIKAFQTTPFTCIQPSNTQFVERSIQLIAKALGLLHKLSEVATLTQPLRAKKEDRGQEAPQKPHMPNESDTRF